VLLRGEATGNSISVRTELAEDLPARRHLSVHAAG
jgi:hypothetical protein